jgi:hypothetical protein
MTKLDRITAYNRTAKVEKDLGDQLVVRWVDNGVRNYIPREDATPVLGDE